MRSCVRERAERLVAVVERRAGDDDDDAVRAVQRRRQEPDAPLVETGHLVAVDEREAAPRLVQLLGRQERTR